MLLMIEMGLLFISDRPRSRLTAGTTAVTSHTSEYRINDGENGNIRVSQGGIYRCRGSRGEPAVYSDKSDAVTISITLSVTQKPSWSQMFRGETITLTCEVQGGEGVQWEYEWRTPQSQTFRTNRKDWTFTASISGDYSCKSRPTDDSYSATKWSEAVRLSVSGKNFILTGTTTVSVGDRVTLSCSVEKSAGWKYEWFRRTSHTSEYRINDGENGNIRVSQGGIYRCRGSRGESTIYSDKSDEVTISITLSVTQKPSWSQMFRGETITLTCEVQGGEGVQWEYEWRTPQSQTFRTNRKVWTFTASISGDYSCKSRSTDDSYSGTKWSEAVRVSVSDLHPSASLSVSPDRVQHFTSDSLSLTCEGNSAEWRVGSFLLPDLLSFCSDWGTMNGSTCHVQKIQSSNAVFWCESGSAFSNAVNITGHNDDLILLSPVHPVTEGHSVTLGCKWRTENLLSKVFFYQNDTLIQSESRVEMIIPAVSKSHEGFYKCQSSGKESPQSWLAVTFKSSSFFFFIFTVLFSFIFLKCYFLTRKILSFS
uniref:Ig-like domain-containing protein n=1 Tax=Oryzias melastigma TaxID=30732 RepID=A0A3B3DFC2_ORYME